jgi:hypothetical protein
MLVSFPFMIKITIGNRKKTTVIDRRNFKPHEPKEIEEWNPRELRHEKYIGYLNCKTGKIEIRKVSK